MTTIGTTFPDKMMAPAPSTPVNNSSTLSLPFTPGVNLTEDQFTYLMRHVGLKSSDKTRSKKILTPNMGDIYAEEAWTGGAPKLGWTGLAKDPSLTVPVATQIRSASLKGATNMIT